MVAIADFLPDPMARRRTPLAGHSLRPASVLIGGAARVVEVVAEPAFRGNRLGLYSTTLGAWVRHTGPMERHAHGC